MTENRSPAKPSPVQYRYSSLFDVPAKSKNAPNPLMNPVGISGTDSPSSLPLSSPPLSHEHNMPNNHIEPKPSGSYINGQPLSVPSAPNFIPTTFAKRTPVRRKPVGASSSNTNNDSISPAVSPLNSRSPTLLSSPVQKTTSHTLPVTRPLSFIQSSNNIFSTSTKPLSFSTSKVSSLPAVPLSLPTVVPTTNLNPASSPMPKSTLHSNNETFSNIEFSNPSDQSEHNSIMLDRQKSLSYGEFPESTITDSVMKPVDEQVPNEPPVSDLHNLSDQDSQSSETEFQGEGGVLDLLRTPAIDDFTAPTVQPFSNSDFNQAFSEGSFEDIKRTSNLTYSKRSPCNKNHRKNNSEFEFLDSDKTPTGEPGNQAGIDEKSLNEAHHENVLNLDNASSPISNSSILAEVGYGQVPNSSQFERAHVDSERVEDMRVPINLQTLISEGYDWKRESTPYDNSSVMDHYHPGPEHVNTDVNSIISDNEISGNINNEVNITCDLSEKRDEEPVNEESYSEKVDDSASLGSNSNISYASNERVYDYYTEEFQPKPIDEKVIPQDGLYVIKPLCTGSSSGYDPLRKNSVYSEASLESSTSAQSDNYYYEEHPRQLGIVNTNNSDDTNNDYSDTMDSNGNSSQSESSEFVPSRQSTRDSYRSLRSSNSTNTNGSHPLYMNDISGLNSYDQHQFEAGYNSYGTNPYSVNATATYPEINPNGPDMSKMVSRVGSIKRKEIRTSNLMHSKSNSRPGETFPGPNPAAIAASSASVVRRNSSVLSSRPKSVMSNASSKTQYGKGVQSAYVYTLRRKAATVWCDVPSKVWGLPIEISDAKNSFGKVKISKGAMDIRHSHLKPRLLDSEVDSSSSISGGSLGSNSSVGKNDFRGNTKLEREGTISRYPMNNPKATTPSLAMSELSISRTNESSSSSRRDSSINGGAIWTGSTRNSIDHNPNDFKQKSESISMLVSRSRNNSESSVESIQDVSKIKLFVANPDM
ncbi:hypothetical protein NADFUDRAFT_51170 [Nadsonia fulvescens var. elongata DSM 6958]|uniref:Uncharacterized protein n=1 Tax=Nadsonia fulvescens var. elongata DSM 6958 TaxID=857566 RepID=A0A1E3PKC5_9ASCO|nr:hypothetical protein NADFUDRAFT_51170 [Nadsonia fulvescens var. elongata DSM 6958]